MKEEYIQHGAKEFLTNRKAILSEYDKILEQNQNRPIQVAHGVGVEAYIRKWLSEFLPKKFGVTSGYIIPNLYGNTKMIYHYDVIIYNALDSPILWVEGNHDDSEQGKYRAIPAKHVVAVYEIKSRLTVKSVRNALEKLNQIQDFSKQLNPLFSCGIIFIDLKEIDVKQTSILKELMKGRNIFRFSGGMVLRFEADESITGRISLHIEDENSKTTSEEKESLPLAKAIDELNIFQTEDGNLTMGERGAGIKILKTEEKTMAFSKFYGVHYEEGDLFLHLTWSRSNFAEFCMNLLYSLENISRTDSKRPIFGQIFDTFKRKEARLQPDLYEEGKPFLRINLHENEDKKTEIIQDGNKGSLKFWILIENLGYKDILLSDDSFKNSFRIPKRKRALTQETFEVILQSANDGLIATLEKDKVRMNFRWVYYEDEEKKDFIAVNKTFLLDSGSLIME